MTEIWLIVCLIVAGGLTFLLSRLICRLWDRRRGQVVSSPASEMVSVMRIKGSASPTRLIVDYLEQKGCIVTQEENSSWQIILPDGEVVSCATEGALKEQFERLVMRFGW